MEGAAGGESHGSPSLQSADRTAPPRTVPPVQLFLDLNLDVGVYFLHICSLQQFKCVIL